MGRTLGDLRWLGSANDDFKRLALEDRLVFSTSTVIFPEKERCAYACVRVCVMNINVIRLQRLLAHLFTPFDTLIALISQMANS